MVNSAKLLVAEGPPKVPAGDGTEGSPCLTEALDVSSSAVDVCDGSLESDVSQGEDIRIAKNHDAKDRNCPWSDAFNTGERLLPSVPLADFGENFV